MNKQRIYTISELAAELGITPRTIRYYEEVELLSSERESVNHQRLYDARARARLKLILRGKRFGFPLSEIKEMINLYDVDRTQKEQLRRTITLGDKKIAELEEMVTDLQAIREEMLEFRRHFMSLLQELERKNEREEG
ncbi:MAG: MerR family DNA-binding transcriptional regulator [Dethiobacter sp.]|nr:MerR family DNA-binding transcriptional regulator [Dethiobacter sp.]